MKMKSETRGHLLCEVGVDVVLAIFLNLQYLFTLVSIYAPQLCESFGNTDLVSYFALF